MSTEPDHHPSAAESATRRGVQPCCADQPSPAASEHAYQDSDAPHREVCDEFPDEVSEMLSGLASPD
jgi:hypothetical protein